MLQTAGHWVVLRWAMVHLDSMPVVSWLPMGYSPPSLKPKSISGGECVLYKYYFNLRQAYGILTYVWKICIFSFQWPQVKIWFPTAKIVWLFTYIVHLLESLLSAGPNVTPISCLGSVRCRGYNPNELSRFHYQGWVFPATLDWRMSVMSQYHRKCLICFIPFSKTNESEDWFTYSYMSWFDGFGNSSVELHHFFCSLSVESSFRSRSIIAQKLVVQITALVFQNHSFFHFCVSFSSVSYCFPSSWDCVETRLARVLYYLSIYTVLRLTKRSCFLTMSCAFFPLSIFVTSVIVAFPRRHTNLSPTVASMVVQYFSPMFFLGTWYLFQDV